MTNDKENTKVENQDQSEALNIESKINQIFEEAKKRNPEGYTLSTPTSPTTSTMSSSRSTSPIMSSVQFPYSQYDSYHSRTSSNGSGSSYEEKDSGSGYKMSKFINPESGQQFCILATTVNVPVALQQIT